MYSLVRKTLEIFLTEKRVITQSEFPADTISFLNQKDSVFITLYEGGRVIASSGRIQPKKENTLYECIDNTLLCLKDERFSFALQAPENLGRIKIRVDIFNKENRRVLSSIDALDSSREGMMILSQTYGKLAIVLPHMMHVGTDAKSLFSLVCKKA
jgi:AMMECR1 domain-containing protein